MPGQPLATDDNHSTVTFQVSPSGRLLKPAPLLDPLPKPLDPSILDPESAQL